MDDASSYSFPVRHKKFSVQIKLLPFLFEEIGLAENQFALESKVDIVICNYDDQFLVIATEIGTMGTIMHARKEEGMLNTPTFNVSVIFGKRDEPMLLACARQLIEHISNSGSSKPLTLSLGLKDHSMEILKGIVSAVIENRLW
ncbi:putative proteasome assembly chaperone 3 [Helianthus annuus]|nr:putative proteasome assembly chaperone 3 [Helianthus annuus]